jgi:hypothetical protein
VVGVGHDASLVIVVIGAGHGLKHPDEEVGPIAITRPLGRLGDFLTLGRPGREKDPLKLHKRVPPLHFEAMMLATNAQRRRH